MNFEIKGTPSFGAIADLVGRANPRFRGQAVLTAEEVVEMRRMYAEDKMRVVDIANHFGITRANASNIIHRHSWTSAEVEL